MTSYDKIRRLMVKKPIRLESATVFLGIMSLITILMTTITLEAAPHTPGSGMTSMLTCSTDAGRCKWETHKPRKEIGLRVKLAAVDIVSAFLVSILLIIGEEKKNPYCFMPWLIIAIRGFLFCEIPSLLRIGYIFIPIDGLTAALLFSAYTCLLAGELCVMAQVFGTFRSGWKLYMRRLIKEKRKYTLQQM
ncbi:hypothetical protein L9F63_012451 [Diploptera punctata]|uniref:Uncharacterized protein n=1 Tax=Diploptera punctata TaxID=6984 RepID=A0AAD8ACM3_DIPPU|nr:hypothetical protein L9F63_012451 [Diploptera punctata]